MRRLMLLAVLILGLPGLLCAQGIIHVARPDPANLKTESASVLALRDGGTAGSLAPQDWRIYQYCDAEPDCATGYSRARLGWSVSSSYFDIADEFAGTGSVKSLRLGLGFGSIQFAVAGLPQTDNATNLGGTSNRWATIYVARSIQGAGAPKSLTDAAAAVAYMTVAVPTDGQISGELIWDAKSVSGADHLVASGTVRFWGAATGTTPVCGINKVGTDGEGHSGGANTLVCTWTNVVSGQTCALSVTCTNDLADAQAITVAGRPNMPTIATVAFP